MTLIKTCGMWSPQDIQAVNEARPDFVGFVVNFPKSHRSVSPDQLRALRKGLRRDIEVVGVFVDEEQSVIANLSEDDGIDLVQLHGSEDESYIASLREICEAPIIKAFKIKGIEDLEKARSSSADLVLLDNGYGTGECFDWGVLDDVEPLERPFILAGGLTPENIASAIESVKPWAVDLSSGLETNKKKDASKIALAVKAVRES